MHKLSPPRHQHVCAFFLLLLVTEQFRHSTVYTCSLLVSGVVQAFNIQSCKFVRVAFSFLEWFTEFICTIVKQWALPFIYSMNKLDSRFQIPVSSFRFQLLVLPPMQWILCIYLLQFLCFYVYCNLVKIFRGEVGNLGGNSPPEGPEKTHHIMHTEPFQHFTHFSFLLAGI